MPSYIASGGHYFGDVRYRFLILPRFDCDLHSLIKNRRVDPKNILVIADQLLDILEHLHDNGYAHSDIKAENIMVGRCVYPKKPTEVSPEPPPESTTIIQPKGNTAQKSNATASNIKPVVLGKRTARDRRRITSDSEESEPECEQNDKHGESGSEYEEEESDDESEDEIEADAVDSENDEATNSDESGDDQDFNVDDIISDVSDESSTYNSRLGRKGKSSRAKMHVEFSGSNPVRSCRMEHKNQVYDDMVSSHYLRRSSKRVNYCDNESENEVEITRRSRYEDDDDWEKKHTYMKRMFSPGKGEMPLPNTRKNGKVARKLTIEDDDDNSCSDTDDDNQEEPIEMITEMRVHLIDFGLALKFMDSAGIHRPFVMDQRRAHDGTLEFTSRDAHMGAHSRRSDLECLAYNLIYWQEGFLPWKNEKLMTQPEQVHRMKEYFMTDWKQLYKKIYGVAIPTYINDFLSHVTNLAYHDRPDYKMCKEIFQREFVKLGFAPTDMVLDVADLENKQIRKMSPAEAENNNVGQKLMDVTKMMKLGMVLPFCESPTSKSRISPKNLRSKTDKNTKKRRQNFSWTEILSTDPDQIARQRAEKEFERDQTLDQTPVSHRYSGNPTYAILEVENNKTKSKIDTKDSDTQKNENTIKGYTKPMMDVWRKRQVMLMQQFQINGKSKKKSATSTSSADAEDPVALDTTLTPATEAPATTPATDAGHNSTAQASDTSDSQKARPTNRARRGKAGLRRVKSSKKLIETPCDEVQPPPPPPPQLKRKKAASITSTTKYSRQNMDEGYSGTDESSNCSSNSNSSDTSNSSMGSTELSRNNSKYNGSCGMPSPISEGDSHDNTDFSPIKTRRGRARKIVISDEDSRDTTDYSPVKRTKAKLKTGSGRRRRSDQKSRKGKYIQFPFQYMT